MFDYRGTPMLNITTLRLPSYLRISSSYEVPMQVLRPEPDGFGGQLMLRAKGRGGIKQLRDYLRHRENQSLNGVVENVHEILRLNDLETAISELELLS